MTTDEARARLTAAIEGHGEKNYRRVIDEMFPPQSGGAVSDEPQTIASLHAIAAQLRENLAIREKICAVLEQTINTQTETARIWRERYEQLLAAVTPK